MLRPRRAARVPALLAIGLIAFAPSPHAANDTPLSLADLAWDRGDYPAALNGYLQILDSPQGDAALESIALRTGELYKTIEVTSDGAVPQFSRDGRHFLYEIGAATRRAIRLFATSAPTRPIAELKGWSASFAPDNATLAYLKTPESPDITAAQIAVDTATAADRAERTSALTDLLNAGARITLRDLSSGAESSIDTGAIAKAGLLAAADGHVVFTGAAANATSSQIYLAGRARAATALTSDETVKSISAINSTGTALIFTSRPPAAGRGGRGGGGGAGAGEAGAAADWQRPRYSASRRCRAARSRPSAALPRPSPPTAARSSTSPGRPPRTASWWRPRAIRQPPRSCARARNASTRRRHRRTEAASPIS